MSILGEFIDCYYLDEDEDYKDLITTFAYIGIGNSDSMNNIPGVSSYKQKYLDMYGLNLENETGPFCDFASDILQSIGNMCDKHIR